MDNNTPPLSQLEENHRYLSEEEKKRVLIELLHLFLKASKKQPQASTKDEEMWRKKWKNGGGVEKGSSLSTNFSTSHPAVPSLPFSTSRSAVKGLPKDILQMASSLAPIDNFVGFTENLFHRLEYEGRVPSSFHRPPHHHRRRQHHHRSSSMFFIPASSSTASHAIKRSKATDCSTSQIERELSSPDTNRDHQKEETMHKEKTNKENGAFSLYPCNDLDVHRRTHERGEAKEATVKRSKRRKRRTILGVDTLRQEEERRDLPLTDKKSDSRGNSASTHRSYSWRRCVCCSGSHKEEKDCERISEKKKVSSHSSSFTPHRPSIRRSQKESLPPSVGFVDAFRNRVRGVGPAFTPCFGRASPSTPFSVQKTGGTASVGSNEVKNVARSTRCSSPTCGGSRRSSWSTKMRIEGKRRERKNSSTEETFFDEAFTLEGFMNPLRRQYRALAEGKRKDSRTTMSGGPRTVSSASMHADHVAVEGKEVPSPWRTADTMTCESKEKENRCRYHSADNNPTADESGDEKESREVHASPPSLDVTHSKTVAFSKPLSVHSSENETKTHGIRTGGISFSDGLPRDAEGTPHPCEGEGEEGTPAFAEVPALRMKSENGGIGNTRSRGSSICNGDGKCLDHSAGSTSDSTGYGAKISSASTTMWTPRSSLPSMIPSTVTRHTNRNSRATPYGRTELEKESVHRKGKRGKSLSQPPSKSVGKRNNSTYGSPSDEKTMSEEGFLTSVHSPMEVEKKNANAAVVVCSTTMAAEDQEVWKDYDPEKAALWMTERNGEKDFFHTERNEAPRFDIPSTTDRKHITSFRVFVPSRSIAYSAFFVGILEGAWRVQDDYRQRLERKENQERHEIERRRLASLDLIFRDKLESLWLSSWMKAFGSVAPVVAESFLWFHIKAAHDALWQEEEKAWALLVKGMYQSQCHYFHSLLLLQQETISSLHGQLTDAQSSLALTIMERMKEEELKGKQKTAPQHRCGTAQGQEQLQVLLQELESVPKPTLVQKHHGKEGPEKESQVTFLPPEEKQIIFSESAASATGGIEAEEYPERALLEVIPAVMLGGETVSQTDDGFKDVPLVCWEQKEDGVDPPESVQESDDSIVPLELQKSVVVGSELSVSGSLPHAELLMVYTI